MPLLLLLLWLLCESTKCVCALGAASAAAGTKQCCWWQLRAAAAKLVLVLLEVKTEQDDTVHGGLDTNEPLICWVDWLLLHLAAAAAGVNAIRTTNRAVQRSNDSAIIREDKPVMSLRLGPRSQSNGLTNVW